MSLLRSTLIVGAASGLSRILGFTRDVLLAQALGGGPVADAFVVAFRLPNVVRRVMSEGALNAAFVPAYARIRAEGGDGPRFAGETLAAVALVLLGLVAAVEIGAGAVVLAVAAGLIRDAGTLDLASLYTRLAFPSVAAVTLASLVSALLVAERRLVAASMAPLLVNGALIATLIGLARVEMPGQEKAAWLAAATSGAGLLHLAVVLAAALRRPPLLRFSRPRGSPDLARLVRAALPALAAVSSAQVFVLAGLQAASLIPSGLSWLYYADRVFQLPLGFVGSAAGMVLLPEIASRHATAGGAGWRAVQDRAIESALLLTLPAAAALFVLAQPIAAVLFERGAFGPEDTRGTAAALAGLSLGLPFAAVSQVMAQTALAAARGRAALLAGALGLLVTLGASTALMARLGIFGAGLGIGFGFAAQACLLSATQWGGATGRPGALARGRLPRIAAATAVMAFGLAAAARIRDAGHPLALAGLCLGGALLYAGCAWLFGAVTRADLAGLAKRA